MTELRVRVLARSIGRVMAPPMEPTALELRSRLFPEEFERALSKVPAIVRRPDRPYLRARRQRGMTVTFSGQNIEIAFRSAAIWDVWKGIGRGNLLIIEVRLNGRIAQVTDGSVLTVGLHSLSAAARTFVRFTSLVTSVAIVATMATVLLAPRLALVPFVLATTGVSIVVSGCVVLRAARRQKADEIARMLLAMNHATAATTRPVPGRPSRGLAALIDPWLRDVPGPMIVEAMRRLEAASPT